MNQYLRNILMNQKLSGQVSFERRKGLKKPRILGIRDMVWRIYTLSRVQSFASAIDFCAKKTLQQLSYSAVLNIFIHFTV